MAPTTDQKLTPQTEKATKRRHDSLPTPEGNKKRTRMSNAPDDDLVKKITAHFDSTTEEFKRSFNKKFEEVNARVGENAKDISEIKQAIKRIEQKKNPMDENPDRLSTGTSSTRAIMDSQLDRRQEKYDTARRSLRIWPVNGKDEKDLNVETWRFIRQRLLVPDDELGGKQIERIRRIRSAKKAKIQFEVSVLFNEIAARDRVAAHGKNLAPYQNQDGTPSAGMRIEYPDFLGYTFRSLDWFGKDLKNRFGGLKRNIRYDDDKQTLCMDVLFADAERWERISAAVAIEEKKMFDEENESNLRQRLRRPRPLGRPFGSEYSAWHGSKSASGSEASNGGSPNQSQRPQPSVTRTGSNGYKSPTRR